MFDMMANSLPRGFVSLVLSERLFDKGHLTHASRNPLVLDVSSERSAVSHGMSLMVALT
jgi:hypothetical protein